MVSDAEVKILSIGRVLQNNSCFQGGELQKLCESVQNLVKVMFVFKLLKQHVQNQFFHLGCL